MDATAGRTRRIARALATVNDEELTRDLFTDALRIARSVIGSHDPHLSLTAAHDALLAVIRHRHRFRGEGSASTWLFTIVRREALRVVGRERRRSAHENTMDERTFEHATMECATWDEPVAALLGREIFERAVTNPVWREIWLLYNDPDLRLSHEEIAARTNRSPGTVAVTLSRVRALLEDVDNARHCA